MSALRAARFAPAARPRAPARRSPVRAASLPDRILALQRTAGNAAVGALLRAREGKGWNPESEEEEVEGHPAAPVRGRAARKLQRLTITQHKFTQGTCGKRNVQWVFSLDNAAPKDGYIVQHVEMAEIVVRCPGSAVGPPAPTNEFWEAWFVKKGDKVDWTTTRDKWTDGSTRPSSPNTAGHQVTTGEIKFFGKDKTGDLGDFEKAPADPKSDWGPGKVPISGALPSTAKKPKWWDDTPIEGPVDRSATSVWECCDPDPKKHTSTVTVKPKP
jgi:hypothetical protein